MSDAIISVEGLGKKYAIRHQGQQRSHYKTFREALTQGATRLVTRWSRDSREAAKAAQAEEFWALRDVSFELERGAVLGIIGSNGAGKSTLLKILSRITEPSEGRVTLRGRVASLLEVGTGFHPELTGRENIYLNGSILGMAHAEIRSKFDEIVAFSGVEKFLDTPVKRYSSGMQVRLAFAVAAHLEPEILVIDEVLAVGDAEFQKKCLGKMHEVTQGEGRTVLFVSHNMNAVESLCRQIIHLSHGRLLEQTNDVRDGIARYLSAGADAEVAEWRNPGNALENRWFRPMRFYIGDEASHPLVGSVRRDAPVFVYIEGEIAELDAALQVGYALYDETGTMLYWSTHVDAPESRWPQPVPGWNRFRSKLPADMLNEGTYRLDLLIALYYRQWLSRPGHDAPAISLNIQGGISQSTYWTDRRPTPIAPICDWEIDVRSLSSPEDLRESELKVP